MRSFFDLVGFEYKKIFKRKSAVIVLVLVTAVVCAYPLMVFFGTYYIDGIPFESHYQAMVKDRAYEMALSGRAIDETLIAETKDAYSKITELEGYGVTPEYQQYARPYNGVFQIIRAAYDYDLYLERLLGLTEDDMRNFYQTRHESVISDLRISAISDAAKDQLIRLDSEIKTPFVFAYCGGFGNLLWGIYIIGIACAFALAVCLAPVFAGEYSTGADQLILSSKLGKNKLISAKLFTAVSLFMAFFFLLILLAYILCSLVYGYDGADAPLQLIEPLLVYPLTMLEAFLICAACAFFATFLVVALTLLLSSKFKSPFGVIIIISVLLFAPMIMNVPGVVWLHNLISLLPSNMMAIRSVFSHVPFDFFGFVVPPYVFLPLFAILASVVTLPFARRAFRNHQIG